jgi:alkylhydroperoxidase family enzyme
MTHRTAAVRSEVEPLEWAVFEDEINPDPLTRRQYLVVRLADAVARHEMSDDLADELLQEFSETEFVALVMCAAKDHFVHVMNTALKLPPAEGSVCRLLPRGAS